MPTITYKGLLGLALLAAGCGWNAPAPGQAQLLTWARCLRAHGQPGFPDPNAAGAFDSSRFDDSTPAFHAASQACMSLQPRGAVSAVPGRRPSSP
jgi:hypothetical protein